MTYEEAKDRLDKHAQYCLDGQDLYALEIVLEQSINKSVIENIKIEIETNYGRFDICEYFEDYDYEENDISEYRPIGDINDILQIIDKYKAEREEV